MRGKIAKIIADRGFGFIRDGQGTDVFFHCSGLSNRTLDTVAEGDVVEFEIWYDPKREKNRAVDVRVV